MVWKQILHFFLITIYGLFYCSISASAITVLTTVEQRCVSHRACSETDDVMISDDNGTVMASCCLPCSCDASTCVHFHNCCPDVDTGDYESRIPKEECLPLSVSLDNVRISSAYSHNSARVTPGVTMVTECFANVNDTRCSRPNATNLEENIPVSNYKNAIMYRNKYCALCNNVSNEDILSWKPYLTCPHSSIMRSDDLLFPSTTHKMFEFAVKLDDNECGFISVLPENIPFQPKWCFLNVTVIGKCPPTFSDSYLIRACNESQNPYVKSSQNETLIYQNYFCYLCNNPGVEDEMQCHRNFDIALSEGNGFVVELNVGGKDRSQFMLPWQQNDLTPARHNTNGVKCGHMHTYDPFKVSLNQHLTML